jgi:hypothetical protein
VSGKRVLFSVLFLILAAGSADAAANRWWAGGGLGLSFSSDYRFVSVEPVVGYNVTKKLATGGRLIFRYVDDKRFDTSSTDYGASVFARYFVAKQVFVQGEFEYLWYEYAVSGGGTTREGFDSLFGGVGFSQPIGRRSSFFVSAMYNFSYDDDGPSPYADAWVIRAGVGFGF